MNEEQRDLLLDLLTKKAVHGLDASEQEVLDSYDKSVVDAEFRSFEATAAAINLAAISDEEPLPIHLRAAIIEAAPQHFAKDASEAETPWPPATSPVFNSADVFGERPARNYFGWLGWAAATVAVIALAANVWLTRFTATDERATQPIEAPRVLTIAEQREEMLRSTPNIIKANWAPGNVKEIKQITGDVIWSDEKQAGYIRLRGLPVRTAPDHCYQLWIYDKVQDKATPIDGGMFDVTSAGGEVIIPINAKIKADGPYKFALTIERHGGVVVSKGEKIAALASVETRVS